MHTHMNRPNSCLLVRFSFSLVILSLQFVCIRFSFLGLFCVIVCVCVLYCFCCVRFSFFSTTPRDWLGTTATVLRPFFRDHPGEPVPEENFWTLWCKGRLTEADTLTIRLGATPSGLTSAYLHHP